MEKHRIYELVWTALENEYKKHQVQSLLAVYYETKFDYDGELCLLNGRTNHGLIVEKVASHLTDIVVSNGISINESIRAEELLESINMELRVKLDIREKQFNLMYRAAAFLERELYRVTKRIEPFICYNKRDRGTPFLIMSDVIRMRICAEKPWEEVLSMFYYIVSFATEMNETLANGLVERLRARELYGAEYEHVNIMELSREKYFTLLEICHPYRQGHLLAAIYERLCDGDDVNRRARWVYMKLYNIFSIRAREPKHITAEDVAALIETLSKSKTFLAVREADLEIILSILGDICAGRREIDAAMGAIAGKWNKKKNEKIV